MTPPPVAPPGRYTRHMTRDAPISLLLHGVSRPPKSIDVLGSAAGLRELESKKEGPGPRLSLSITVGFLSVLTILIIHSLCYSCFDSTRTCAAILSSIFFLPLVRPFRWMTRIAIRVSLWSTLKALSFLTRVSRSTYLFATSVAHDLIHHSHQHKGKYRVIRASIGALLSCFLAAEIPFRLVVIGCRIVRLTFHLLRTFVLLQYYMFLLTSLELMIYLRVDCVMAFISAPCFRWAISRVWSMLTWTDLALAFSPSAYYYVHLFLHDG